MGRPPGRPNKEKQEDLIEQLKERVRAKLTADEIASLKQEFQDAIDECRDKLIAAFAKFLAKEPNQVDFDGALMTLRKEEEAYRDTIKEELKRGFDLKKSIPFANEFERVLLLAVTSTIPPETMKSLVSQRSGIHVTKIFKVFKEDARYANWATGDLVSFLDKIEKEAPNWHYNTQLQTLYSSFYSMALNG